MAHGWSNLSGARSGFVYRVRRAPRPWLERYSATSARAVTTHSQLRAQSFLITEDTDAPVREEVEDFVVDNPGLSAALGRFRSRRAAKVSIFGSGLFGMISGSSIANTVTVGSLTIPAMIRVGYARHFAGAVEAAAATGGQITPPIMGAAAFLMVEYLAVPYQTIIVAAIVRVYAFLRSVLKFGMRVRP